MKISNLGLQAFYQTALKLNMTVAAEDLGVTQSALSQRITSLENDLETTLFIREGRSLALTKTGEDLFKYSSELSSLENEIITKLKGDNDLIAGVIRIGAYSSILRSILIPQFSHFLRSNPMVTAEFKSYETNQLYDILRSGMADFVVLDYSLHKKGIIEKTIGFEEYVVIESIKYKTNRDVYLDHDYKDNMTAIYFAEQANPPSDYRRSFMGDVYGIIEGVEEGLGRAVMSKHLISKNKKVQIVKGMKSYKRPIVLHYFERPYYSDLFKKILDLF